MRISRAMVRVVVLLTLMVLQAQVLASLILGCRHGIDGGTLGQVAAACPMHLAVSGETGGAQDGALLDCHKCALHSGAAAPALPAPSSMAPPMLAQGLPGAVSERHFYRFSPESPLRPPITAIS